MDGGKTYSTENNLNALSEAQLEPVYCLSKLHENVLILGTNLLSYCVYYRIFTELWLMYMLAALIAGIQAALTITLWELQQVNVAHSFLILLVFHLDKLQFRTVQVQMNYPVHFGFVRQIVKSESFAAYRKR